MNQGNNLDTDLSRIICGYRLRGLAPGASGPECGTSIDPDGASKGLIYGDVAVMFLFQGFYSVAWTPLLYLYPPEVMNYSIRANGVAFSQLALNGLA